MPTSKNKTKEKKSKQKKIEVKLRRHIKTPIITIERILFDGESGRLKALDVHNETDGCAYYLEVVSTHFHGFKDKKK